MLDLLSKDRLRLGLGRGLARREFAAFRISMDEPRERFDEVAPMINALGIRFIEGDGISYQQSRTEIRPRPLHSFDGRIYGVASSEDSMRFAAKLGAHMVMFADRGPLHGLSEGSCVPVCGGSSAASKPDPLELRKRMPD